MKPQDILFIVILLALLITRKPKWLAIAGFVCLIASVPLFHFWIFFTAQRLIYYAWAFFLITALIILFKKK